MATATLTEFLDNLYTTTWQNMKDDVKDQVFDATPFWFWLKEGGRMEEIRGGRFLTEPLQFDKTDNIQWIGRGGTVRINDFQFLTVAKFDWRYIAGTITRFGVDDQQNAGRHEIMSLMNSKMENVRNSLINEFETRLAAGAGTISAGTTTEDALAIDGLQFVVPDDPTASQSFGGYDPSVATWWQNKSSNMTGKSFAAYGIPYMRTLYNNCGNNLRNDMPDIWVSGQTPYEYYEDQVLPIYRVTNRKLVDMGFDTLNFKGKPMIWTPAIAATRMYALNTKFLRFTYDPSYYFDMTEWKPIPNQVNDRVSHIVTACALKCSRRRCQGVLYNIDTP